MGNAFSKKETLKDRLIILENQINSQEGELQDLMATGSLFSTFRVGIFIVPAVSYLSYYFEIHLLACLIPAFIALALWYLILNRRKDSKRRKIDRLKENRKDAIERCKNDVNFAMTKNLIEKYDDEESRNTFFNQVLRKKKSPMDSVSEIVLGSDPSSLNALICTKCGVHNGLVDPKNDNFQVYYCFSCRHKNIRRMTASPKLLTSPSITNE